VDYGPPRLVGAPVAPRHDGVGDVHDGDMPAVVNGGPPTLRDRFDGEPVPEITDRTGGAGGGKCDAVRCEHPSRPAGRRMLAGGQYSVSRWGGLRGYRDSGHTVPDGEPAHQRIEPGPVDDPAVSAGLEQRCSLDVLR
jgi:hypothetical protein